MVPVACLCSLNLPWTRKLTLLSLDLHVRSLRFENCQGIHNYQLYTEPKNTDNVNFL